MQIILADLHISKRKKSKLKEWECDFVWGTDEKDLLHISFRCNLHNVRTWDSPEYQFHIQFACDIWEKLRQPSKQIVGRKSQHASGEVAAWKVS
jgi:hypothetical protein